jgi:hypothetical protein
MKPTPHARPYWHVDAKWICGILFALGLLASLLLYIASTLTSEKVAVPVATQIVAGMFSRNGLDDDSDLEEFKQKALKQPGEQVETLPGAFVSKTDLRTLSPRELRLKIFKQVVEPYYQLGAKGVAAKQSSDPAKQAQIEQQAGLLAYFNKSTHESLQRLFFISLAFLLLPLAGLVYFSAGFGRLVSPGLILVLLTFPGAFASLMLAVSSSSSKPVGGESGQGESIAIAVGSVAPSLALLFGLGVALLLAAGIGKAVANRKAKTAPAH